MVLSSWQIHCESSPGSFDECRMAPSGRRPKTKPDDLGCESACTGCQKLHPPPRYVTFYFLSRVSVLTRDIDTAILSVCPSVRHVPVLA